MEEPRAKHPIQTIADFKIWRMVDMVWTQDECAKHLGYKSRQSIAKLETGRAKIIHEPSNTSYYGRLSWCCKCRRIN